MVKCEIMVRITYITFMQLKHFFLVITRENILKIWLNLNFFNFTSLLRYIIPILNNLPNLQFKFYFPVSLCNPSNPSPYWTINNMLQIAKLVAYCLKHAVDFYLSGVDFQSSQICLEAFLRRRPFCVYSFFEYSFS